MAVRSSNDRRFRQLAVAVARGDAIQAAGKRLGQDWSTNRAWSRYGSFRVLVEVLKDEPVGEPVDEPVGEQVTRTTAGRESSRPSDGPRESARRNQSKIKLMRGGSGPEAAQRSHV